MTAIDVRGLRGRKALVVDDNPVNRLLLQHLLVREEMFVQLACDGEAAVRQAEAEAFDIVLMDVAMPVMDGRQATRAIRALAVTSPAGERFGPSALPIIAVTANTAQDEKALCLAAGMNAYVTKPIDRLALLATMARLLVPG